MRCARRRIAVVVGTAVALCVSAGTAQAVVPGVTTGAATRITSTGATLTGRVNPRSLPTTYFFEYGPTTAYGARTPAATAGAGAAAVAAAAPLTALAPSTRYHFRLVAQNASGVATGADRTFRTSDAIGIGAAPNPVRFGASVTIEGTVTGPGNAGQTVQVQQRPFPITGGFVPFGNAVVTDAQGRFAIALLSLPVSTQFRATVSGRPGLRSNTLVVRVRPVVRVRTSRTHVRRGGRVHFSGTIRPAEVGRPLAIQKRRGTRWITVSGMLVRARGTGFGVFDKTIRVPRGGQYRIFVGAGSGATATTSSRVIRIRTR
jgi:hypothetical protein